VIGSDFGYHVGVPAAANRGGAYNNGLSTGLNALILSCAPSTFGANTGFRCVIPG